MIFFHSMNVYMYMSLCVYQCFYVWWWGLVHLSVGAFTGPKKTLDLPDLNLKFTVSCLTWVLETKLSLVRVICTPYPLNYLSSSRIHLNTHLNLLTGRSNTNQLIVSLLNPTIQWGVLLVSIWDWVPLYHA